MRRSVACLAAGISACIVLAGCGGAPARSRGGLSAVSPGPSAPSIAVGPPTAIGAPSGTAPPTTGGTTAQTGKTPTQTGTKPYNGAITVVLDDPHHPIHTSCPQALQIDAFVTVDRGPVTLTYAWSHDGVLAHTKTVAFKKTGKQTADLYDMDYVPTPSLDGTVRYELVVLGHPYDKSKAAVPIEYECVPSVTDIAASTAHHTCPYPTVFSVTMKAAIGPITVPYTWKFSDGTSSTGNAIFAAGNAPQQHYVSTVVNITGTLTARLEFVEAGSTYVDGPLTVDCSS
jgi:hypothetical protein